MDKYKNVKMLKKIYGDNLGPWSSRYVFKPQGTELPDLFLIRINSKVINISEFLENYLRK